MSKKETKTAKIIAALRADHHDTDKSIALRVGCTPSLVTKVRKVYGEQYAEPEDATTERLRRLQEPAKKVEAKREAGITTAYEMYKFGPNTAGVDPNAWTRSGILNQAEQYVNVDRAATHGDMEDNFSLIAEYWALHLGHSVTPEDVATMMALLKIARLKSNPTNAENWIDTAGYMACGGELATQKDHK
jgi:hypothetical protein